MVSYVKLLKILIQKLQLYVIIFTETVSLSKSTDVKKNYASVLKSLAVGCFVRKLVQYISNLTMQNKYIIL